MIYCAPISGVRAGSDCVKNSRGRPCLIPPPGDGIPGIFKSR